MHRTVKTEGWTTFRTPGNLQVLIDDVVIEATKFTATCYGVNFKAGEDMSEVRVEVWSRKICKKNLSTRTKVPPTNKSGIQSKCQTSTYPSSHLEVLCPAGYITF